MAIVRNGLPDLFLWGQSGIKGAKLFLVELLPGDTALAPESPAARIRSHTFLGAVDDEDAITPDEILRPGIFHQWHQRVEARSDQRFEGLCLLPDFLGRAGEPVTDQPRTELRQIGPADRERTERVHQVFGDLLERVGAGDGYKR